MTKDVTLEHIRQSNLIEGIDDPEEDKQSLLAWEYLTEQKRITNAVICKVQKTITLHQDDLMPHQRGYYRDMSKTNVYIGKYVPPLYWMMKPLMDNFVLDMSMWRHRDPVIMHIRFEKIHPFADGNGRTGRMLLWWHQIMRGEEPTLWLNDEKWTKYYRLFDKRG